jgi:tRNA(Ser,Leu) C12 N-acetylase TAN1
MQDWNVVVSVRENAYRHARARLKALGAVHATAFHNVLTLTVEDVPRFLDALQAATQQDAELRDGLGRAVPVARAFAFQSPEEFETKAKEAAAHFLPGLGGKRFYVRVHRRGFRERLSSQSEERALGRLLLDSLAQAGTPGALDFADPDAVLVVEIIGTWAGMSLLRREELARYPFLHPD